MVILSIFHKYQDAYVFTIVHFFIKFSHMFVLPDVLSASFSCIQLLDVVLSVVHFCTALTETLNMILSQKS